MWNYKTNCNTLSVTKECSQIPGKGLWTNSSWFLWIRVEVLYEALLVKHKWGTQTNTAKHISMNEQYEWCKAQYKRERERFRDSGSNANIKICFEVRVPSSTSPPSHRRISTIASTQDFPHMEPPLRIWVNTIGSTQLLSQPIQPLARGKAQTNHLYT